MIQRLPMLFPGGK